MTPFIIGLVLIVLATIAYVALRNAQDFSDANEVIPGVPTRAPKAWAGAHSPEARLHRRLRDAMTALRTNRALDEPALVPVRETLEREALAVDDQLVTAAALPKGVRDAPLDRVAAAVDAIEQVVADVVSLRGPGAAGTEQAIEEVRTRLALVAEARAELELLGGTSGSGDALGQLRRSLEGDGDVTDDRGDDPGGARGAQGGPG
jgi:hypothetical protein